MQLSRVYLAQHPPSIPMCCAGSMGNMQQLQAAVAHMAQLQLQVSHQIMSIVQRDEQAYQMTMANAGTAA